jgi:hypothetical protein
MKMGDLLKRHHRTVFYAVWLLAGFLHAGLSGLLDDEAYYWMYGRFPAWGYFDHPPLVGVLTRAGDGLFSGSLGVRFFFVLLSTATILGIDSLVGKRDDRLFYAIALGIGLLQFGGVIAVPDIPLMFFAVLFFLSYRSFTKHQGAGQILLLGLTTAGMFYAKYHGVLIVLFTVLSHPRLLLRWQTYAAGLVALLLFMPHLHWQYTHDFPSFRYHLFERNAARYKTEYTIEYLLGQVVLAGPLIGWLLIPAAFRSRAADHTESALKYCLAGIYVFFLLSTFKGRVEANWTAPAFIPLVVLSHRYLSESPRASQWVYRLLLPSLLIVLSLRVYMMLDIDPVPGVPKDEFHRNPEWAAAVKDKAAGMPVVFVNSYQRASQYVFHTEGEAFGLNDLFYRRNNYNFWPLESKLTGRPVLVLSAEDTLHFKDSVTSPRPTLRALVVDRYFSFSQVDIRMSEGPVVEKGRLKGSLDVRMPDGFRNSGAYRLFDTAQLVAALYGRSLRESYLLSTGLTMRDLEKGSLGIDIPLPEGAMEGVGKLKWGIRTAIPGHPSLNSTEFVIERR